MRIGTLTIVVLLVILVMALTVYAGTSGNPEPTNPPGSTFSYTLEDIYDRLAAAATGTSSTFTEPGSGPGTGTMYTLNDIMAVAPDVDNTNGATQTHLLEGKTAWGLTSGEWGLITGTMPDNGAGNTITLTLVPKTGQTDAQTTGDDGDLEMGAAWPVPRFITGTTGVVTDSLTGLIWLENAHCGKTTTDFSTALLGWIWDLNALGKMNTYDCGDTSNGGSHQSDWRLPNVRELESLVHYGVRDPAVPDTAGTGHYSSGDPFTNIQPWGYWTSTSRASTPVRAWTVNLLEGVVTNDLKTVDNQYYVWPVRGGQ